MLVKVTLNAVESFSISLEMESSGFQKRKKDNIFRTEISQRNSKRRETRQWIEKVNKQVGEK